MVLVFLRYGGILFQPVQHTGLQGVQVRTVLTVGVGIGAVGVVQLFLRGSKALGLGHGLKDQVLLCQMLKVSVGCGQHGIGIGVALRLGKSIQIHAVGGGVLVVVVQEHADVIAGDLAGQLLEGGVRHQVVHDGVFIVGGIQRIVKVAAQLVDGVQIIADAKVGVHPLVGQLRGHAFGNGVQRHAEHGFLAAEGDRVALGIGGIAVAVREGDGHVKGIAHIVPDDLVLKAIDEGTAAKGQVVAGGSAAGKGHAVHGAGVIDVGNISALGGTAGNGLGRGVLVQQVVHLLLQFIFGGGQVVLLQGDGAEVLRQGHIVQRFDAAPIAVFVQTIAVIKGLVVEVGNRAKLRDGCGSRRSTVGLLVLCQHETGKNDAHRCGDGQQDAQEFFGVVFQKKYLHKNRPDAQQKTGTGRTDTHLLYTF